MTANDIITVLNRFYLTNPKYLLANLYVFGWESDYLALTRSGYWYEVEVKISRADFFADFKKKTKHEILSGAKEGLRPNYFAYACPEGLIAPEEVPEYAGLIYIPYAEAYYGTTGKYTPQLHKQKITADQLGLADKFYYNYTALKRKYENAEKDRLIRDLRGQVQFLRAEYKAATGYDVKDIL